MHLETDIYQDVVEIPDTVSIPKILVVEDDEFCAILISEFLEDKQYHLSFVKNGEDAMRLCDNHDFDLVLLDIQLPKIDGIQVAKYIKEMNPKIPLIAVTASVINYQMFQNSGIDLVLEKPISCDTLLQNIKQYI